MGTISEANNETNKPARYYFAALNTAEGFQGKFEEIFGQLDRLYIIKGGPGTGKSRFISEIGKEAECLCREVEYFYCSSDPRSYDGIIIRSADGKRRCGIIDGTAPHAYDPKLPGAVDSILNLGDFWDSDKLSSHTDRLRALSTAKKRLYASVYSCLAAVRELDRITETSVHRAINPDKMQSAIDRLLRTLSIGARYTESVRIRSAVGCDGAVTLHTYADIAKNRFAVLDRALSANAFMLALKAALTERRQSVQISYSPFFPSVPDAIYIPEADTSFYVGSAGITDEKTVNMHRFLSEDILIPYKPKLRALSRLRRDILAFLFTDYSRIRALHAETEAIYGEAMSFGENDRLLRRIKEKIFLEF